MAIKLFLICCELSHTAAVNSFAATTTPFAYSHGVARKRIIDNSTATI